MMMLDAFGAMIEFLSQIRTASHLEPRDVGVVRPLAARPLTLIASRGTLKTALQSRKNCSRCVVRRSAKKSDLLAPKASSIIMKAEQSSGARPEGCFVSIHHGSIEGHSRMLVCAAH